MENAKRIMEPKKLAGQNGFSFILTTLYTMWYKFFVVRFEIKIKTPIQVKVLINHIFREIMPSCNLSEQ